MPKTFNEEIQRLVEAGRIRCFVTGSNPTDEEVLGILVSRFLGFHGHKIKTAFAAALEDSNWHGDAAFVQEHIEDDFV